jgi:ribonuclease E
MDKNNKMLIDATHPEETRVVVLRQGRVEEFDYESASRKLLRGNIYLAKVTRVEPSLQAAFVDYGGNRHGFLAFNEIHPDYYQIPVADRQALLQEEAEAEAQAEEEADAAAQRRADRRRNADDSEPVPGFEPQPFIDDAPSDTFAAPAAASEEPYLTSAPIEPVEERNPEPLVGHEDHAPPGDTYTSDEESAAALQSDAAEIAPETDASEGGGVTEVSGPNGAEPEQVEQVGTEDAMEEVPERPRRRMRSYKIQEVIKRRQIILVQVVKEERGNKGAALTTYLSLAGRYTVLMPNTGRGGGISRKITNAQDRKRLKAIANELEVPEGMGLIIRTAGAARTKQEIKRDYEYLLRLWESVRDMTLQSTAPCLVYEEGNLIKRSIRDLYSKDIDEIVVAGDAAHREAHDFMGMLQPGGTKNVSHYHDADPLFTRFQIERQLNAMFSPYVTLRSGGYLVINQTEALVSIDVNSGKSTREFSIEETALNTNIEAADEIARQLKLRDLAGLIVIDFIDMEEKRNNRAVERRLKDALRHDRARIQVGRISHFGLLEMSRQRLRTGVLEGSTTQCPHCQGTGIIRSTESVALAVLRGIEDELMKGRPSSLTALTTASVALYILNHKRAFVTDIERRYGITISVHASERMQGANFAIERAATSEVEPQKRPERNVVNMDWGFEDDERGDAGEAREPRETSADEDDGDRRSPRGRRRRRGRRGDRAEHGRETERTPRHGDRERDDRRDDRHASSTDRDADDQDVREAPHESEAVEEVGGGRQPRQGDAERGDVDEKRGRRRRRGRRGGRNREGRERTSHTSDRGHNGDLPSPEAHSAGDWNGHAGEAADEVPLREPAPEAPHDTHNDEPYVAANVDTAAQPHFGEEEQPAGNVQRASEPAHVDDADRFAQSEPVHPSPAEEPAQPTRKGWWQKRFGGP